MNEKNLNIKEDYNNLKKGDYVYSSFFFDKTPEPQIRHTGYFKDIEYDNQAIRDYKGPFLIDNIGYSNEMITESNPNGLFAIALDGKGGPFGITEENFLGRVKTIDAIFHYTSDNMMDAQREICIHIMEAGLHYLDVELYDMQQACRNAYGKELSKEDFEKMDPANDEAWFNDYDMTFNVKVFSDFLNEEQIERILRISVPEYDCLLEEYEENYKSEEIER